MTPASHTHAAGLTQDAKGRVLALAGIIGPVWFACLIVLALRLRTISTIGGGP